MPLQSLGKFLVSAFAPTFDGSQPQTKWFLKGKKGPSATKLSSDACKEYCIELRDREADPFFCNAVSPNI